MRHDYSDVVVRLSRLYAARAPAAAPADGPRGVVDERSFVRATTKYWVRSDDLSAVKLAISRHLPVLVSGGRVTEGESKASQLLNSVYLASPSLELYHGRLAKLPGAVALRLRWYGTGEPEEVFVERKTHRDAWTGDASVKERFRVLPGDVPRLLRAEYEPPADLPAAERRLAREVQRLVSTKRLVPTVRSQCHRTAFQLAHTNAVRASIDTNLCLINEVQREDDDHAPEQGRWYRDAARSIPSSDLTRFPFAVLELKLALAEADDPGVRPPDKFGFTYKESLCTCCGRMEKDEDSLEWFGTGNMSWLHGIKGKVAEDPHSIERKGTYAALPERPRDAAAAAALFGNDPSNDAARKATLRRLELIEADDKIEAAKTSYQNLQLKKANHLEFASQQKEKKGKYWKF